MLDRFRGIIVVDKPESISSAAVVARVKRSIGARKVGHAGTLDPFATGVMICCINEATRLSRFFLKGSKTYRAVVRLGIETDTQDATGTVIATWGGADPAEEEIHSVIRRFEGAQQQVPPAFSALKHRGVPLYRLARKGIAVQKPARTIRIHALKLLKVEALDVHMEIRCSAGTYIRSLAADMGKALGCGGHLKSLRRVESCGFTLREAVCLSELEALSGSDRIRDHMIGMADALQNMPEHLADGSLVRKIRFGNILTRQDLPDALWKEAPDSHDALEGSVKILYGGELIAVLACDRPLDRYAYRCVFQI